ncbi:hypothetical protein BJV82DRAFT_683294 [Fennellomyces sp. T-0311]|nr:hypothetical protein BJV82DRAFT_683294 [Fennellomyces sp. T-0311]
MAQEERTAYFAALCEQLYNPKSSAEREQAQKMLEYSFPTFAGEAGSGIAQQPAPPGMENSPTFAIVSPTDTASALRVLLESSPNPLVQTFCLSRLKQLILAQFSIFARDTKLQLRTFLLEYCFMHPDLQPFVIAQLAGVVASLTRLGWADMEEYRNVQKDINQFLQASMDHRIVGLQMLAVLVQDINSGTSTAPLRSAQLRKAAAAFRDTQLFDIFQTAFDTLAALLQRNIPFEKPGQEDRLKDAVISVLLKCLSYDFAGTNLDDAGEDIGVVQIPASWRSVFEDETFVPTLFTAYRELQPPLSSKVRGVMECLVLVASVRKALFSGDTERSKFVMNIMQGVRDIIFTWQGMNDTSNYNEFCRLLFRFRATAPLNEMAEKPGYVEWIGLIADFTLKAWAPETTHYLLGFWFRIIQSMTSYSQINEVTVQKLKDITVELTRTYITTNVESVPTRLEEMLDDPLETEESLVDTLGMLGHIARCKYEESSAALVAIFDPIAVQYQELIAQARSGMTSGESFKEALEVIETKFAWLVYIIAAFIGSRPAFLSSEELDAIDGELTTKVLQLMDVNQALQNQHGSAFLNQKLDMAFIYFFMQFRKAYIGETNGKSVYTKLADLFGISDQILMLDVIMRKMYSAVKNLRKIETTRLIMQNHMSSEFAFFESSKHQQNRMLYYQVLCKVLFSEDNNEREFHAFMKPFELRLQPIETLDSVEAFRQDAVRRAVQDIFRDLRGFIQPIQNRRHYLMFFDWFYPDYMPIVLRALEAWSPDPAANTLLKFFSDFVFNRSQRLNFPISSPNSILVFRDTSQVIATYGRHINERQVTNASDKYPILSRCLGGRYINFGVFWLYQDKAIDEAFHMMFQLMLSIPLDDLMGFPKLARAFVTLLDDFTQEQLTALPTLEPSTFLYLMQACELAVESTESFILSHACAAINNICTFVAQETEKNEIRKSINADEGSPTPSSERRRSSSSKQAPATHWLMSYLTQFPNILPSLLVTILNLVLFDDTQDQWALSRPLYVLMLLQKEV